MDREEDVRRRQLRLHVDCLARRSIEMDRLKLFLRLLADCAPINEQDCADWIEVARILRYKELFRPQEML